MHDGAVLPILHLNGCKIANPSILARIPQAELQVLFAASAAQAEMMKFIATLTGAAAVPANDSAATGTAEVMRDTEAKTVTWTYADTGLSGDMTASHIHGPASATESAGPVIDTTAGMQGSAPITDA